MKFFKSTAILGFLMLSLTGCALGSESPEQLIDQKPIYNENNKKLYESVNRIVGSSASLLLPANLQDVGKINKVDLDNNGIEEIIVFEKSKNLNTNESEVGFFILNKKQDDYEKISKESISGESIEYANFYDLDNDGNKEIILAAKGQIKTTLYVYKYIEGKIKKSIEIKPTWINDRYNLTDMKIEIGYINNDNKLDILMANYDSRNSRMYVSVINYDGINNGIKLIDYVKFDNVKNISELYITLGNIASQAKGSTIKGIVLDIPMTKESSYFTQMLYFEGDNLKKAFEDNDKSLMKSYYIPVEDINKDKVIDIPILNGSLNENTYTSKSSANISWYSWNGKKDSSSGLLFTIQVYYNYEYNYKFLIQNNLANKIYVEQETNSDNVIFKFNYYDEKEKGSKTLFTITAHSKNIVVDESKNINLQNQVGISLKETDKYNFILTIVDTEQLNRLDLTVESLKEYFSLIYE